MPDMAAMKRAEAATSGLHHKRLDEQGRYGVFTPVSSGCRMLAVCGGEGAAANAEFFARANTLLAHVEELEAALPVLRELLSGGVIGGYWWAEAIAGRVGHDFVLIREGPDGCRAFTAGDLRRLADLVEAK